MSGTLFVTMGIPGSGKSSWARHMASSAGAVMLSTDVLRTEGANLTDHLESIAHHAGLVLVDGGTVVIDACNVHTQMRRRWLRIGLVNDARCVLAIMGTPHRESIRRNEARAVGQRVAGDRMAEYVRRWQPAVRATGRERWAERRMVEAAEVLRPGREW